MQEEIDLREYILAVLRYWWIVGSVIILAAVLGGFLALRSPEEYEARAKLLIIPRVSEGLMTQTQEVTLGTTLSVETLHSFATANDLLTEIISTLELKDEEGKTWAVESLSGMMRPEVETAGRGNAQTSLPLLTMTVIGENPELLKRIANTWATHFIIQNAELFSTEAARSYEFIESQYAETGKALKILEDQLQAYNAEQTIPLMEMEANLKREDLNTFLDLLIATTTDLHINRGEYQDFRAQVKEFTVDGDWIGFGPGEVADLSEFVGTPGQKDALQAKQRLFQMEGQVVKMEQDNALELLQLQQDDRLELLQLQQDATEAVTVFKLDNELALLETQYQFQRNLLGQYTKGLEVAQSNFKISSQTLDALLNEIEGQPQFLVLVKAIDDAALWQQLGMDPTSADWELARKLGLKTEVVNTTYTELNDLIISTRVSIRTDQKRVEFLTTKISETKVTVESLEQTLFNLRDTQLPNLEAEMNVKRLSLEAEMNVKRLSVEAEMNVKRSSKEQSLEKELARLRKALTAPHARYERELSGFLNLISELPDQRRQVRRLEFLEKVYQEIVDSYRLDWESLSRDIELAKLEVGRHERQVNTLGDTLSQLAQRRQEARIAKEEQGSSIRMVESAVKPQVALSKGLRQNLLISGILGLLVGIFGALIVYYLRTPREMNEVENLGEDEGA